VFVVREQEKKIVATARANMNRRTDVMREAIRCAWDASVRTNFWKGGGKCKWC